MNYSSAIRFFYKFYPFQRGKSRLRSFAMRHIHGIQLGRDRFGNLMLFNLDSLMDCMVYLDGANELPAMTELKRWVDSSSCDTFIDIGANIGCFSLFFSKHPKIQTIYAFEPDPSNNAQLVSNIWLNDQQRKVKSFEMALSEDSGMAVLFRPQNRQIDEFSKFNMGTSGLDRYPRRHDESEKIEVAKRKLDDVLALSESTIAIKIDVEGHELAVLSGMKELLKKNNCGLMMEVWSRNMENSMAVSNLLAELGYLRCDSGFEPDTQVYTKHPVSKAVESAIQTGLTTA